MKENIVFKKGKYIKITKELTQSSKYVYNLFNANEFVTNSYSLEELKRML